MPSNASRRLTTLDIDDIFDLYSWHVKCGIELFTPTILVLWQPLTLLHIITVALTLTVRDDQGKRLAPKRKWIWVDVLGWGERWKNGDTKNGWTIFIDFYWDVNLNIVQFYVHPLLSMETFSLFSTERTAISSWTQLKFHKIPPTLSIYYGTLL